MRADACLCWYALSIASPDKDFTLQKYFSYYSCCHIICIICKYYDMHVNILGNKILDTEGWTLLRAA